MEKPTANTPVQILTFFALLLSLSFSTLVLNGCRKKLPPLKGSVITDTTGRKVRVPKEVKRIICIAPGTLRLITYLGATHRLVGVESFEKNNNRGRPYRLAHPEVAKLPIIGPGGPVTINRMPDLEKILAVRPEVIFISYLEKAKATALQKKLSIPVVVLTHGKFATFDERVFDSLRIAGTVLGRKKRAEEVISFIQNARKDLKEKTRGVSPDKKPTVYIGGIGYKGGQGIGSTDTAYVPFDWVGAKNMATRTGRSGHVFVDKETLLKWNPDHIFIDGGGLNTVLLDKGRKPDYYSALKAARNNQVYTLFPYNYYVTNISTAIVDAYYVGKILYPKRFAKVDLAAKAAEVYRFLVGKPVYDEMKKTYGPPRPIKFD